MKNKINWDELFKIRIANSDKSFRKHEVVKTLLVTKLIEKHRRNKNWIRVYTEQELPNGNRCDVYFENVKEKTTIIYEIQKKFTKKWIEKKKKESKELVDYYMNNVDLIIIDLNKCPEKITEIDEWLDKYVF